MARYKKRSSDDDMPAIVVGGIILLALINFLLRYIGVILETLAAVMFFGGSLFVLYCLYQLYQKNKKAEMQPAVATSRRVSHRLCESSVNSADDSWVVFGGGQQDDKEEYQSVEPLAWDETILPSIEWRRFEHVCTEYYRLIGFMAHQTNVGADGGVDIKLYERDSETPYLPVAIVQCKFWNTYKVGVKLVRELYGIMSAEKVDNGILITSGEFTKDACEFAQGIKVELISGAHFLQWIRTMPENYQKQLLDIALEGDYKTPTCPQCDIKMVLRDKRTGNQNGEKFWGCVRYPRCRQTFKYSIR